MFTYQIQNLKRGRTNRLDGFKEIFKKLPVHLANTLLSIFKISPRELPFHCCLVDVVGVVSMRMLAILLKVMMILVLPV